MPTQNLRNRRLLGLIFASWSLWSISHEAGVGVHCFSQLRLAIRGGPTEFVEVLASTLPTGFLDAKGAIVALEELPPGERTDFLLCCLQELSGDSPSALPRFIAGQAAAAASGRKPGANERFGVVEAAIWLWSSVPVAKASAINLLNAWGIRSRDLSDARLL